MPDPWETDWDDNGASPAAQSSTTTPAAAPSTGGDPWDTDWEHPDAAQTQGPLTWTGAAKTAITNIPSSAYRFGHDIAQPFMHPVDTATNLKNVGQGVLEKTGIISGDDHEKYADAVGKFFVDRYGSAENVKKTLANDPVGIAADLSMFLTGGGSALARAPGTMGKIGEAAAIAGDITNPLKVASGLNAAPKLLGAPTFSSMAGTAASEAIGGLGTHTGGQSLRTAASSGYAGGDAAQAFRDNLRDVAPMEDTVTAARKGLENIRTERGNAYRDSMAKLGLDNTVLDFSKINDSFNKVNQIKTYKGQSLSPSSEKIRGELQDAVINWQMLDPDEFHTVEGMDAFKQKIGDIRDGTERGTPERVAADQVYNAVRNTILKQAPEYARTMKGYENASKTLKEIEKTLSLNPNATIDTSLRKLQSVLRDNVNTSYGRRGELADYLVKAGAPHLMERLAGQSLKPWTARGLGKLGMELGAAIVGTGVGMGTGSVPGVISGVGTLAAMSPRTMGEAAHFAGRAARRVGQVTKPVSRAASAAFQVGRLPQVP